MSVRRVLTALLLALGAASASLVLSAPAALAQSPMTRHPVSQDPVALNSGHVVDQARVLSEADIDTIEAAAAALKKNHKITLYVVFVDHFTNPSDAEDWANETAARNDLGPSDYLLAVDTGSGAYSLSGDDSGPVSDRELTTIEQNQVEPKLKTQDWTQAAVGTANALGDAVGGGSGTALLWVLVAGLIVVAGVVVLLVRRQRSSRSRRSMT